MPRLPALSADDLGRVALRLGFELDRQRGSHAVYVRAKDQRRIVIPRHTGDLKRGTARSLVADMGITVEELLRLL